MFRFLRIHTVPPDEEGSTWLQLFFDLVYVAILVEIGNRLSHEMTLEGIITYILVLLPIWLSWLEFVDYGRRYPVDDIGQRILTVLYMAFMMIMAFEIHNLRGTTATVFFVTFGISRFVLALMYARVWIYYPSYRRLTRETAASFLLIGVLWIILALLGPFNLWRWALVAFLVVLMPNLVQRFEGFTNRTDLPQAPIKYHFMLHRFGELTIIVLGEFFIKLAINSSDRELATINYLIGAGLLCISVSLWWLYFDHLEHTNLNKAGTRIGAWILSHFPFTAGIVAYGAVGNQIFAATPQIPLEDNERLLFTTALACAMLAFGAIEWASKERDEPFSRSPQPWIRIGNAAVLLALGFLGHSINVGWLVLLVVCIMLLQVGLDISARLRRPKPELIDNMTSL